MYTREETCEKSVVTDYQYRTDMAQRDLSQPTMTVQPVMIEKLPDQIGWHTILPSYHDSSE
jgi:hypothetical protein